MLGPECHSNYPGQKDALTSPGYGGPQASACTEAWVSTASTTRRQSKVKDGQ